MTQKSTFVRDLTPGQNVDEIFLLASAQQGQAKNGPFWSLTLADRSGEIPTKIFSPQAQAITNLAAGQFVRIRGMVGTYRDQPQVVADAATVVEPSANGLQLADFVPASERDPEDMLADLEKLCKENIRHKPLRVLVRTVLTNKQIKARIMPAPGAISIHHAYAGGLVEHTLSVCRLCMSFCDLYPELDRQVLLAAAVFHDLGKAWEYAQGPVREHTDEGRLLGHIQLGLNVIEPFLATAMEKGLEPEVAMHLKHIIVSHHGELEFGSPKRPKTPEAFALHFADNLDAKLKTVAEAVEPAVPEDETGWSPYVRSLGRFVYKPKRTPDPAAENGDDKKDEQCLLPLKA
ncbi:3'-5' exoribonuclease YhaM family protein [Desulfovibrio ferrophilus]|uniref:Putative HD superfamily hydrolase n=1 Tax=Desulfovibrio ferrophilus TaxID=241368 RepID=A0A2Z6B082_9BACT|nr:HD domain-containing protein [Desulfovibrio ferrophilus]BBD08922.1 putative HD superfamily hydrolase [Desulfovibrio ferrophilus]